MRGETIIERRGVGGCVAGQGRVKWSEAFNAGMFFRYVKERH